MTRSKAEEVAASLSEQMAIAVRHAPFEHRISLLESRRTSNALERRGIIEKGRTLFTPLGLAVREHLLKEQG